MAKQKDFLDEIIEKRTAKNPDFPKMVEKSMDKQEQKEIYYLSDYNWERGYLVSVGPKNFKIKNAFYDYEVRICKDKCALPDELVCVVWETWKGKNGRGGYRVEREMYSELRVRADKVARQMGIGRVREEEKHINGNSK